MANRKFSKYTDALMRGTAIDLLAGDLYVVAVDTGADTPNTDLTGDDFLDDIAAGARITSAGPLLNTAILASGALDADDIAMPDAGGASYENLLLVKGNPATPATSRLLVLFDTVSGLPLTPDNVNDLLRWHASGIFAL